MSFARKASPARPSAASMGTNSPSHTTLTTNLNTTNFPSANLSPTSPIQSSNHQSPRSSLSNLNYTTMYRTIATPRTSSKDTKYDDVSKGSKPAIQCPFCEKLFHLDEHLRYHLLNEDPCHYKYKNLGFETDKRTEAANIQGTSKSQIALPPTPTTKITSDVGNKLDAAPTEIIEKISDDDLTIHYRINDATNSLQSLRNICLKSSDKSQYNFGGKSACTTIALEFCCHFLHNRIAFLEQTLWNFITIDDVVKAGCMQDPQRGNLSFIEAFTANERFQQMLEVVEPSWQGDLKEEKAIEVAIQKFVAHLQQSENKKVAAILTKPPETIAIVAQDYLVESDGKISKLFVAFDSHPRVTDSKSHGAHSIIFIDQNNLVNYLKQWVFPYSKLSGSLDEMFNVFSITVVQKKPKSKFFSFSVDSIVDKQSVIPNNQTISVDRNDQNSAPIIQQLKEENEKLQNENRDLKSIIKRMNDQIVSLEKYKELYTKLKQQDAKLNQSATISNLKAFLEEHKKYQQTFAGVEGFFQNLVQAAASSNGSESVEKK